MCTEMKNNQDIYYYTKKLNEEQCKWNTAICTLKEMQQHKLTYTYSQMFLDS